MATEAKVENTKFYRYMISKCNIILKSGAAPIVLPEGQILGMELEKDYDNDYFPIFCLKLYLDFEQYYSIVQNKATVKFDIQVDKFPTSQSEDRTAQQRKFPAIQGLFSTYLDDNSSNVNKELQERTEKLLGSSATGTIFDFYLFNETDLIRSGVIVNKVLASASMTTAVCYLLSKAGFNNVLMGGLQTVRTLNEVLLMPVNVINNLNLLEQHYGLYYRGMVFFIDHSTTYLLNRKWPWKAHRANEYTKVNVMVYKRTSVDSIHPGSLIDNDQKIYIINVTQDAIQMNTTSLVVDRTVGSSVKLINSYNPSSITVTPNIETRTTKKSSVIVNNFDNVFSYSILEADQYENANIIQVSFADVDLTAIAPNKEYVFIFEDTDFQKKYGSGSYRISDVVCTFTKSGTEYMMTAIATFKKTLMT